MGFKVCRYTFQKIINDAHLKEESGQLSNGRFIVQPEFSCAFWISRASYDPGLSELLPIPYTLQQFVASAVVLLRSISISVFDASQWLVLIAQCTRYQK